MKPSSFPQATKTLAKPGNMTEEECGPLPVYSDGTQCISLWQMTWPERLKALFFGRLWVFVYSGVTQPPIGFVVDNKIFSEK